MAVARCWNPKCRITISGCWRKGAPTKCPNCGWTEAEVKKMLSAQVERKPSEAELLELEKKNRSIKK